MKKAESTTKGLAIKPLKKRYKEPKLTKLGDVKEITLKTGSVSDFGSNQFQP